MKNILTCTSTTFRIHNKLLSKSRSSLLYYQPIKFKSVCNTRIRSNTYSSSGNIQLYNQSKRYCPGLFKNNEFLNTQFYQNKSAYRVTYLQNLKNNWNMQKLKWQHDPNFDLKSFNEGVKQVRTL